MSDSKREVIHFFFQPEIFLCRYSPSRRIFSGSISRWISAVQTSEDIGCSPFSPCSQCRESCSRTLMMTVTIAAWNNFNMVSAFLELVTFLTKYFLVYLLTTLMFSMMDSNVPVLKYHRVWTVGHHFPSNTSLHLIRSYRCIWKIMRTDHAHFRKHRQMNEIFILFSFYLFSPW